MSKRLINGLTAIIFLLIVNMPGIVGAKTSDSWPGWLASQIEQNPEVIVARENLAAIRLAAVGRTRPLYNPELETEYEREGDDNNYRIGLNQTLDIWGKRGIRTQQSQLNQAAAETEFELTVMQKTADVLQLLVEWQAARQAADLSRQQQEDMTALVEQVNRRQQAGDAGLIESELAFLSLSENLKITVAARVRVRQAETRLQEQLPGWSPQRAPIPDNLWTLAISPAEKEELDKLVDRHPRVAAARLQWESQQQTAELTRREAKPDPTIGFNAGESGRENVFALTFSIPLNIRNSFTAETEAASQEIMAFKARYQAVKRQQLYAVNVATATLREYQQSYDEWQKIMQLRGQQSRQLLEKHWQSGDLDTTQYLIIRQQQNENLRTGIELETLYRTALIDLYLQTGHISNLLAAL